MTARASERGGATVGFADEQQQQQQQQQRDDVSETASVHSLPRYVSSECLPDWRSFAQYHFHNLVMSGGGSKGYAYIGALKVPYPAFISGVFGERNSPPKKKTYNSPNGCLIVCCKSLFRLGQ